MSVQLDHILTNLTVDKTIGESKIKINNLVFDSRKVNSGDCFIAVRGTQSDGHDYIDKAVSSGAVAIVCETIPAEPKEKITYVQVTDTQQALGNMAATFYGNPSQSLKLVGITGTNGKTTTATLLYQLFMALGYKTGLLSTVANRIGQRVYSSKLTTPDALSINQLLTEMVEEGCEYAFMEVSSHAVDQGRIAGLQFTGAVFTNLSHDHLDYHKTFKAYLQAKKKFFDDLPDTAFALVNIDDRNGNVMVQNTRAAIHRYSLRSLTDFKAKIIENSLTGLHLDIDNHDFYGRLIGKFNAYNLLAVYATARLLEIEAFEILTPLSELRSVEGRFDYVQAPEGKIIGIVDYAHTPDALEKVLSTIEQLRKGLGKVITVVGCGGDRDKAKRPLMAKVACNYSDQIILTSDNPRSEDPDQIIEEMEVGIPPFAVQKTLSITNRKQAIKTAVKLADAKDIILVAGKGHEKYQEIKGVKHPFDDKAVLEEMLRLN